MFQVLKRMEFVCMYAVIQKT